jgi:hypothetical protein
MSGRVWFEPDLVVLYARHPDWGHERKRRFLCRRDAALAALWAVSGDYRRLELTIDGDETPLARNEDREPWADPARLAQAIIASTIPDWAQNEEEKPKVRA